MKLKITFGPHDIDSIAYMRDALDDAADANVIEDYLSAHKDEEYIFTIETEDDDVAQECVDMAKSMGGLVPEIMENKKMTYEQLRKVVRHILLEAEEYVPKKGYYRDPAYRDPHKRKGHERKGGERVKGTKVKGAHVKGGKVGPSKTKVITREYEPKTESISPCELKRMIHEEIINLLEKEYRAIPGMKKYLKKGKFDLGKCIEDLKGEEGIKNPAAVCRSAEIALTGKAQATAEGPKSEKQRRAIMRKRPGGMTGKEKKLPKRESLRYTIRKMVENVINERRGPLMVYPENHPEFQYAEEKAYEMGMAAALAGNPKGSNPFEYPPYRQAWQEGWLEVPIKARQGKE